MPDVSVDPLIWAVAYIAAIGLSLAVAAVSWHRRTDAPVAARFLAAAALALAAWSALDLTVVLGPNSWRPGLLVAFIPVTQFAIAIYIGTFVAVSHPQWRPRWRRLTLVLAVPVAMSVAALTNGAHHLVFVSATGDPQRRWVDWEPGPLIAVHLLWNYLVLLAAAVVAMRAHRHASALHRRQLTTIVAGAVWPILGSAVSVLGPWRNDLPDLSGVALSVTMALYAFALFRQGLVALVPVARGAVLEGLADCVVVVDPRGRVVDSNAAAARLGRSLAPEREGLSPGRMAADAFAELGLAWPLPDGEHSVGDADPAVLDARTTPLTDGRGRGLGSAVVIRDVTEAHAQRAALAAANERLVQQVTTIDLLRAELSEQAVRDELTGLHNRRYLTSVLSVEESRGPARDRWPAVVLLDIDHFKRVNDTYGHEAGDEVLKAVAGAVRESVRDLDTVVRYGGEEFVVLLPSATLDVAAERAEQIRARCEGLYVPVGGAVVGVTISAGVAVADGAVSCGQDLLRAADEALYRAKAQGRNRVLLAAAG